MVCLKYREITEKIVFFLLSAIIAHIKHAEGIGCWF
jgi:hypothetical protein